MHAYKAFNFIFMEVIVSGMEGLIPHPVPLPHAKSYLPIMLILMLPLIAEQLTNRLLVFKLLKIVLCIFLHRIKPNITLKTFSIEHVNILSTLFLLKTSGIK